MVFTKKHQLIAASAVAIILGGSFWWQLKTLQTDLNLVKQITLPAPIASSGPAVNPAPILIKSDADLTATLNEMQASLSALQARLKTLETSGPAAASPAPTVASSVQPAFQPQNIYLGSASTTATEWVDTAAAVQLNSGDYPSGVHAVFEASLSIVGGEVWARLKNTTTGAILSATEIFHNSATVTWKTSGNWQLHSGNNNYVVQLKSSSGETANLSSARIRISR